jgi:urea transport system permease protein
VNYKLAIWVLSAVICGLAGALYVPQVGIINPARCRRPIPLKRPSGWRWAGAARCSGRCSVPASSIGAKSWFTTSVPGILAAVSSALLFIVVTLYMPQGVVGLLGKDSRRRSRAGEVVAETTLPAADAGDGGREMSGTAAKAA